MPFTSKITVPTERVMSSAALLLFLSWSVGLATVPSTDSPPSPLAVPTSAPITIIVLDDIGYELLELAKTPTIDALAAGGIAFQQAWAYPVCSSARAALLTGRHALRTGIGGLIKPDDPSTGLALSETTLAELLVEPVEMFGKWHVGHGPRNPNDQGLHRYAGCRFNLLTEGGIGYYDYRKTVDGLDFRHQVYATIDTTDDALASIASVRIVAYHAAHAPFQNPPGGKGQTMYTRGIEMVEFLDREIGRLLSGYSGFVFLLSDNGGEPLWGGKKGSLEEGGIRVPFVVHGPDISSAVSDDLVSVVDVFATVADLRGVPCFAEDSVSLLPILRGEPGRREIVYTERFYPNHTLANRKRAIRDRAYKMVLIDDQEPKLYSMPGQVPVPPPYSPQERAAIERLRAALPR